MKNVKIVLVHIIIFFTLYIFYYENIYRNLHIPPVKNEQLLGWMHKIKEIGRICGIATRWRMYSPPPENVFELSIYAQMPDRRLYPVKYELLSREYRKKRSVFSALFWDFKLGRLKENLFVHQTDIEFYIRDLLLEKCRIFEKEENLKPEKLILEAFYLEIPPIERSTGFEPLQVDFQKRKNLGEIACP